MQKSGGGGFTILEVMLFLAISGALFVGTLAAISGRREGVEFQQAIRDVESKMNDVINQVASGYYPSNDRVKCVASAPGAPVLSSGVSPLGSSSECVYLGKVVQFTPNALDSSDYNVISVAARRLTPAKREVSSLAEAYPTAVANPSIDITEQFQLQYGLRVTEVKDADTGVATGGAVAFFSSFPKNSTSGALSSGEQHVSVGIVPNTVLAQDVTATATAVANLKNYADNAVLDRAEGVKICLSNETASRRARIVIGGTGATQTVAHMEFIDGGAVC